MRKHKHGTTLLELAVYLFVFAFVSTAIYSVLIGSTRNYQLALASTEVQQSVQAATFRLSRELEETSSNSIVISSSGIVGVAFESARDANFHMQYEYPGNSIAGCDSANGGIAGMPCWHEYVCYYLDADSSAPSEMALYRTVKVHADSWNPGTPGAPSTFQSDTTLPKTIIARHLSNSGFSLTQSAGTYILTVTAVHNYGNANNFTSQLTINPHQ